MSAESDAATGGGVVAEQRKLTKLMRQVEGLYAKASGGAPLNKDERAKLERREEIASKMKALGMEVPDAPPPLTLPPLSQSQPVAPAAAGATSDAMSVVDTSADVASPKAQQPAPAAAPTATSPSCAPPAAKKQKTAPPPPPKATTTPTSAATTQPHKAASTPAATRPPQPKPASVMSPAAVAVPAARVDGAAAQVGDVIRVRWPLGGEAASGAELELIKAEVYAVQACADVQHNSKFKYTLRVLDVPVQVGTSVPNRVTRLGDNIKWRHISRAADAPLLAYAAAGESRKRREPEPEVAPEAAALSDSSSSSDDDDDDDTPLPVTVKRTALPPKLASATPLSAAPAAVMAAPTPKSSAPTPAVASPMAVDSAATATKPLAVAVKPPVAAAKPIAKAAADVAKPPVAAAAAVKSAAVASPALKAVPPPQQLQPQPQPSVAAKAQNSPAVATTASAPPPPQPPLSASVSMPVVASAAAVSTASSVSAPVSAPAPTAFAPAATYAPSPAPAPATAAAKPKRPVPPHERVLAPMVGASELAFRLLCRRYNCQLAYTPMMMADQFVNDADYRAREFQTTFSDRPLVAHFAANAPHTLLAAARLVEAKCDAIDLNLGCPQRIAHSGHFGSFLLDDADRELVLNMVRVCSAGVAVPVFVKIRLLATVEATIEFVRQLHDAGAALIAVHARHRVPLGQKARAGPAHIDQVAAIKAALPHVRILANGNVRCFDDAEANRLMTGADGVMSAEGLLDDPALFAGQRSGGSSGVGEDASGLPSRMQLAFEYLGIVDAYPTPIKSVVFHVRRMAKLELNAYALMDECVACTTVAAVRAVLERARDYASGVCAYDPAAAAAAAATTTTTTTTAAAAPVAKTATRLEFEARMKRKAKREGLALDHYLLVGAEAPTDAELVELRALERTAAMTVWKTKHAQHCFNAFVAADGCTKPDVCPFLHPTVATAPATASVAPATMTTAAPAGSGAAAANDDVDVFG